MQQRSRGPPGSHLLAALTYHLTPGSCHNQQALLCVGSVKHLEPNLAPSSLPPPPPTTPPAATDTIPQEFENKVSNFRPV